MQISQIIVSNRFRKDIGDLKSLKNSISEIGLLHPVVINETNYLIAGQRRLLACQELGWKEIPVTVINLDKIIKGEYAENAIRKDFDPSEAVAIWEAMESYQKTGKKRPPSESDEPRDRAAKILGMSHDTLSKAKQVVEAAKKEPDKYQSLQKEMDKSGNVNKAYKKLRQTRINDQREAIKEAADLVKPNDRWHIEVADIATWQAPRQYDFIITDPPYPRQYLPLYETLAIRAVEWLKPGGLLIAMCGQSYLNQIYKIFDEHLTYYWTAAYLTPGQPTPLRQVNVNTTWKPLLIYINDNYSGKIFGDVFKSDANDKSYHEWGQSESGMKDIISKLCLPGQYILDPFCGAGTTGIASLEHECLFDGIDISEDNVKISIGRLSKYDTAKN
jgi:16S rRNA G966 N2-methylase RsmD